MGDAYRAAGVDTEAAAKAVALIADLAERTRRPEVADAVGGFAGLFRIGDGKLLAAATDGVGTKLEIARMTDRLETVGIDLVAMCADDVVCTGAEPLFFLDYLAIGRVVPERVARIVEGVAEGCRRAGCALLGGETAEHPGVMAEDAFDLAGFCVGVVEETELLGPDRVREGDLVLGLPSTGLHANGFSLVREAVLPASPAGRGPRGSGPDARRRAAGAVRDPRAHGARAAPRGPAARGRAHHGRRLLRERAPGPPAGPRRAGSTAAPGVEQPVFGFVQRASGASDDEMFSTFNMGVGMVLLVAPDDLDDVMRRAPQAVRIGEVVAGAGVRIG